MLWCDYDEAQVINRKAVNWFLLSIISTLIWINFYFPSKKYSLIFNILPTSLNKRERKISTWHQRLLLLRNNVCLIHLSSTTINKKAIKQGRPLFPAWRITGEILSKNILWGVAILRFPEKIVFWLYNILWRMQKRSLLLNFSFYSCICLCAVKPIISQKVTRPSHQHPTWIVRKTYYL